MMKFGRKIFFTRGLYNSPRTLVEPSRDLPDSFYKILVIIFWLLVFIIFDIFRAKMKKYSWNFFLPVGSTVFPGPLWDLSVTSMTVSMKYRSYNTIFGSHNRFWPEIMKLWWNSVLLHLRSYFRISGATMSFTSLSGGNLVDGLPPACNLSSSCPPSKFARIPKSLLPHTKFV